MAHAAAVEQVRRAIRETCRRLGAADDAELCERILIRDGYYCGRRFSCDGIGAVWFIEENEIKFYDREGGLLCVGEPGQTLAEFVETPRRVA